MKTILKIIGIAVAGVVGAWLAWCALVLAWLWS